MKLKLKHDVNMRPGWQYVVKIMTKSKLILAIKTPTFVIPKAKIKVTNCKPKKYGQGFISRNSFFIQNQPNRTFDITS